MSYPYTLDLAFGNEKSTADPIGRISFGSTGGDSGSHIPTDIDDPDSYNMYLNSEVGDPEEVGDTYVYHIDSGITPDDILGFADIMGGSSSAEFIRWIDYKYKDGDFIFSKEDIDSISGSHFLAYYEQPPKTQSDIDSLVQEGLAVQVTLTDGNRIYYTGIVSDDDNIKDVLGVKNGIVERVPFSFYTQDNYLELEGDYSDYVLYITLIHSS